MPILYTAEFVHAVRHMATRLRTWRGRRFLLLALLAAATSLTAQTSEPPATFPESSDTLETISSQKLEDLDFHLSAYGPDVRPEVSREAAEQVVIEKGYFGDTVRESIFTHLQTYWEGPIDGPVWVISMEPKSSNTVLLLAFIDANTGEGLLT